MHCPLLQALLLLLAMSQDKHQQSWIHANTFPVGVPSIPRVADVNNEGPKRRDSWSMPILFLLVNQAFPRVADVNDVGRRFFETRDKNICNVAQMRV